VFLAQAVRRGLMMFEEKEAVMDDLNAVRVTPVTPVVSATREVKEKRG